MSRVMVAPGVWREEPDVTHGVRSRDAYGSRSAALIGGEYVVGTSDRQKALESQRKYIKRIRHGA